MSTARDYFQQAMAASMKSNWAEAIAALSEAIRMDPSQPEYYQKRGDAYLEVGDFTRSCADYDQANQIRTS